MHIKWMIIECKRWHGKLQDEPSRWSRIKKNVNFVKFWV